MPDEGLKPQRDLSDLAATAAGDASAFEALAGRHRQRMMRFAVGLVPNPAAADEVVQEALLSAFQSAGSFRGEGSARAWLLTITRRAASRWRRSEHPPPDDESLANLGLAAGWGDTDPEHLASLAERSALLGRALASLEPTDREILTLRDVEGLSGDEAAQILELSLPACKTRLHRARLKLMAALRVHGGQHEGA